MIKFWASNLVIFINRNWKLVLSRFYKIKNVIVKIDIEIYNTFLLTISKFNKLIEKKEKKKMYIIIIPWTLENILLNAAVLESEMEYIFLIQRHIQKTFSYMIDILITKKIKFYKPVVKFLLAFCGSLYICLFSSSIIVSWSTWKYFVLRKRNGVTIIFISTLSQKSFVFNVIF